MLPKGVSIKSFTDWHSSQNSHLKSPLSHVMQNELFEPFAKQEDILEHLSILFCKDIYVITLRYEHHCRYPFTLSFSTTGLQYGRNPIIFLFTKK